MVPKFLTQFGISYSDDSTLQSFAKKPIKDDPKKTNPEIHFEPGVISFAGSGPNSRTSQLFISYGNAKSLGTQPWETPIGKVITGMDTTVEKFHSYGDIPPFGKGPEREWHFSCHWLLAQDWYQLTPALYSHTIFSEPKIHGHPEYIEQEFPLTDKFIECHVQRMEGGDLGGELEVDPQEEQRERNLRSNQKDNQENQRHRDLRNPDMFQAQKKLMKEQGMDGPATSVVAASAIVVFLVLGIIYMLLKGRRKIESKTNWRGEMV